MKAVDALFLDHPRSVGETYAEHFGVATSVAGKMIAAGVACGLHGFVPALFPKTASRTILSLHDRMQRRGAAAAEDVLGADCYYI